MRTKYTIIFEDNEPVSIEINGKKYTSPDQISNDLDRARVIRMMFADPDTSSEISEVDSSDLTRILTWVFASAAALMLIIALTAGVIVGQAAGREISAAGVVVALRQDRGSDGSSYFYPVVEFKLPNGETQTLRSNAGTNPPAYRQGDAVTVLFDPQQPEQARIQSFGSSFDRWIVSIITGILGLAMAGAALFARWMGKA
jgi:hypothetical protein